MPTEKTKDELIEARKQAKLLYEGDIPLRTIGELVGVSEVTICNWGKRYKWRSGTNKKDVLRLAKTIIVDLGKTQKEAAAIVGVSEKTMSLWSRKYRWRNREAISYLSKQDVTIVMNTFLHYLSAVKPNLHDEVADQIGGFSLAYHNLIESV